MDGFARYSPFTAMRTELRIVAALIAAAALAWWSTAERMAGMDAGPGTALGSLAWFTGVWATMMAAMMLPSLAPTAAVFAASVRRELSRVLVFAAGYLLDLERRGNRGLRPVRARKEPARRFARLARGRPLARGRRCWPSPRSTS